MTNRLDSDLKDQFDSLCDEFGMSANTAFNIFVRTVVRKRSIPFIIEAPSKEEALAKGRAAFDKLRKCAEENGLSVPEGLAQCLAFGFTWWLPLRKG